MSTRIWQAPSQTFAACWLLVPEATSSAAPGLSAPLGAGWGRAGGQPRPLGGSLKLPSAAAVELSHWKNKATTPPPQQPCGEPSPAYLVRKWIRAFFSLPWPWARWQPHSAEGRKALPRVLSSCRWLMPEEPLPASFNRMKSSRSFFPELVLIQISITQSSLIATSTAQPRLGGVLQRQKSCRPKRTLPRCARACPLPPGSTLLPLPQPSPHGEAKPLLRVPRRQRGWEQLPEEQALHTRLGPGALPSDLCGASLLGSVVPSPRSRGTAQALLSLCFRGKCPLSIPASPTAPQAPGAHRHEVKMPWDPPAAACSAPKATHKEGSLPLDFQQGRTEALPESSEAFPVGSGGAQSHAPHRCHHYANAQGRKRNQA